RLRCGVWLCRDHDTGVAPGRLPQRDAGARLSRAFRQRGGGCARADRATVWPRMIRRYSAEEEQRILVAEHVRDWAHAGLLTAEQAQILDNRLGTGLRR